MAGCARFQFVSGRRRHGVNVPAWPVQRAGDPADRTADGTWCAWRLLGGNNRELGRSARVFGSLTECRSAVESIRRSAVELVPVVVTDHRGGMWAWRLELKAVAEVVAARPYYRQREAQYNLGQFLAAVADATIGDGEPAQRRDERPAAIRPVRDIRSA